MKVGAVAWRYTKLKREEEFFKRLEKTVQEASSRGVELLVLPELFLIELLSNKKLKSHLEEPAALAKYADDFEAELLRLAKQYQITIVGGSHLKYSEDNFINLCCIATPDGQKFYQQKNLLIRAEISGWNLKRGTGKLYLSPQKFGVCICYDSEFPESARKLADAGMLLLCVPSYTETLRGHQRVLWCSHARAIENQIFVALASLVGASGFRRQSIAYGKAAIISPSIAPFPESSYLSQTKVNCHGIAIADLDFSTLKEVRDNGPVSNWHDRDRIKWQI